jgi:outer membrane protein W
MRKLITTSSAALLALGLATGAHAQQYHPFLPTTGTSEVNFAASLDFEGDNEYDVFLRYGYFFNRNFQLGLDASYDRTEFEDDGHTQTTRLGLFANWHFPLAASQLLPYVGLFGGYADATDQDSSTSWGGQAGAKYFFNQNVAGFGELQYRKEGDEDDTRLFFGLAIFFGR